MVKVRVELFRGRWRLRWTYPAGVRRTMATRWGEETLGKAQALMLAGRIEEDIGRGNYDESLRRYQGRPVEACRESAAMIVERYLEIKRGELDPRSLQKYEATLARFREFFGTTETITPRLVQEFRDWMLGLEYQGRRLAPVTVKERLSILSSAWAACGPSPNPWGGAVRSVRKVQGRPKPLTSDEIGRALAAFAQHPNYSFYTDLVSVLLGTGARFGEVSALTWADISINCDQIYFGKSHSRGVTQATTKNQKVGWVRVPGSIQSLLKRRALTGRNGLVFPSRRSGVAINDRVFRKAWVQVLRDAEIPYRKPYSTRATLISHWLSRGEDIATIAELCRTSVKMIQEHYAASVKATVVLPELLD